MLARWPRGVLALMVSVLVALPLLAASPARGQPQAAAPPVADRAPAALLAPDGNAPSPLEPASVVATEAPAPGSLARRFVPAQVVLPAPAIVFLGAGTTPAQYQAAVALARERGADVQLAYPPNAFIARLTAEAETALRGQAGVARVDRARVDAATVRSYGAAAETAANAWNFVFQGVADARAPRVDTPPPTHTGPDWRVPPTPGPTARAAQGPTAGAPTAADTSAYMAGTMVASVVFVQSGAASGNCSPAHTVTETWDSARRTTVLNKISEGLGFWTTRANRPAELTFVVDDLGVRQTSCEPITRSSTEEGRWIADVLGGLGVTATSSASGPNNYFDATRVLAHQRRTLWGADWGYVMYIVDSLNDADGQFTDGAFAYAYIQGPFLVMTYDNDGWGISRLNLVAAHETGHIFGALDEYAASGCSINDRSGYLGVTNASCNNAGGVSSDVSIMGESSEQTNPSVDVSTSARSAIGWRNPGPLSGNLAVVDVVRNSTVSLTPYSPDPTTDTTPTFNASASNAPFPPGGCTTIGGIQYFCPTAVTIGRVTSAEWQMDGGAFTMQGVVPAGGSFNGETQAYNFTPSAPVSGAHTFGTRATNQFGHVSNVAADSLTITGSSFCSNNQWRAEYFNNRTLSGAPVLSQCEPGISYDWGLGSPGPNLPADNFSVRWSGRFTFAADTYTFTARSDDGIRVLVDGTPVIEAWFDHGPTTFQANRALTAGDHDVIVEFYENAGGALAQVSWQPVGGNCPVGQYRAEYFNNRFLSGSPVLVRCDSSIDNVWGLGAPAGVPVGVDNFSVRWTGQHTFAAGNYNFVATSDDGVRVFVDGTPVIDQWTDHGPTTFQASRTLTAGQHEVKVEFYENAGGATIQFRWEQANTCPDGQFQAQYYNNLTFAGTPTVTRCEASINNQWGLGSPVAGVGADNFSVRWSGRFTFAAGDYEFTATADDGVRVFVDGTAVIDAWKDQGPTEYRAVRSLTAGIHEVKVEYYERGGGATIIAGWAAACPVGQWQAQYYDNVSLAGSPVTVRCEARIDNQWGLGPPTGVAVGADNFSVRWRGRFNLAAGSYTFVGITDDGMRAYVDGALAINAWFDQGPTQYTATRSLGAGEHEIVVEFYERGGGANAQFYWEAACPTGNFVARYFPNVSLSGVPAVVACEPGINYEYGLGIPAPGLPADNFSVRWSGRFNFGTATYTFTARADDGVRVFVDGVLVIDGWFDHGPLTFQGTRALTAGEHEVVVEFYERGGGATIQVRWE